MTADSASTKRVGTQRAGTQQAGSQRVGLKAILVGIVAFAAIRYAGEYQTSSTPLIMASSAIAYLLACYLFMGIAWLQNSSHSRQLVIAIAVATLVGLALAGLDNLFEWMTGWMIMVSVPFLVGRLRSNGVRRSVCYLVGLLGVIALTLIGYGSQWFQMIETLTRGSEVLAEDLIRQMTTLGLTSVNSESQVTVYAERVTQLARLIPGLMVMNLILQYTIGTLWFFSKQAKLVGERFSFRDFSTWKMPRSIVGLALLSAVAYLWSVDPYLLIGYNLLFCLGLFYSVMGLAALEYFLIAKHCSLWLRIIIYLLVAVSHIYGLLLAASVGLVDSLFTGWRRSEGKCSQTISFA
ncbi:MAG: DUF2232 domain-containing protein [candidate division Zixibacteria bacterium]